MPTTPAGIYYNDPELAAGRVVQHGPIIPAVDTIARARRWTQTCRQRVEFWEPLELDSEGPLGGILISESEPTHLDGDVVEWQRVYAEIPRPRVESESFVATYQFPNVGGDVPIVAEISLATTAQVHFLYVATRNPASIPTIRATRYVVSGQQIIYIGSDHPEANPVVAADSQITRWAGNIWERRTPYVPRYESVVRT